MSIYFLIITSTLNNIKTMIPTRKCVPLKYFYIKVHTLQLNSPEYINKNTKDSNGIKTLCQSMFE